MKEFIVVITYNFDSDVVTKKCKNYKEAVNKLNEIIERESEYAPSILKFTDDEVILVYDSGYTLNYLKEKSTREYLLQDCAFYRVIEVE